jgi:hypothetical protein
MVVGIVIKTTWIGSHAGVRLTPSVALILAGILSALTMWLALDRRNVLEGTVAVAAVFAMLLLHVALPAQMVLLMLPAVLAVPAIGGIEYVRNVRAQ